MKKEPITVQKILHAINKPKEYAFIILGTLLSVSLIGYAIYDIASPPQQTEAWLTLAVGIAIAIIECIAICRKIQDNRMVKNNNFQIYDATVIDKQARFHSRTYGSNYYLSFDLGDRRGVTVRVNWDEYRQATVGSRYFVVCTKHRACAFSAKTHGVHSKLRKLVTMVRTK